MFWLGKAASGCASYSGPTLNLKEFEGLLAQMKVVSEHSEEDGGAGSGGGRGRLTDRGTDSSLEAAGGGGVCGGSVDWFVSCLCWGVEETGETEGKHIFVFDTGQLLLFQGGTEKRNRI